MGDIDEGSDVMTGADAIDWGTLTVRELLTFIRGMFDELYCFTPSPSPSPAAAVPGRRLMRALAEITERAEALCPPSRLMCSCGLTFTRPDELDDHFGDVFLPADDRGLDGRVHVEVDAG